MRAAPLRSGIVVVAVAVAGAVLIGAPVADAQGDRETWQPPEKIMDAVGVAPGMRIGEAGAGRGYFTFPLARRVGPEGLVLANDISEAALESIRTRAQNEGLENIQVVLGAVEDPRFPHRDLDMLVMVYVLHMLEKPVEFTENLVQYLKPGGRLVIIEKNTTRERAHYPSFMTNRQILETMGETSWRLVRTETFLPRDTIYVFEAATPR